MPDPETGEPINASHMIPRSPRRPVQAPRRAGGLRRAQRRPDGPHAGLHERHLRGLRGRGPTSGRSDGNERGAAEPRRVSRRSCAGTTCRSRTPSSTRRSTRRRATFREPGNDVALHKVGETEHGIIVRGSRILATLAPFADEMAVYPALPLPEGADAYALVFCIPMTTPGLKILCRDSFSTADSIAYDHPLVGPLRRAGRLRDLR